MKSKVLKKKMKKKKKRKKKKKILVDGIGIKIMKI
jgi:hypothetical protein